MHLQIQPKWYKEQDESKLGTKTKLKTGQKQREMTNKTVKRILQSYLLERNLITTHKTQKEVQFFFFYKLNPPTDHRKTKEIAPAYTKRIPRNHKKEKLTDYQ